MKSLRYSFLIAILWFNLNLGAQEIIPEPGPVFEDGSVPRIDLILPADSLNTILAEGNELSDYEFHTTFIFDDGSIRDTLEDVGFRLRGNTSRFAEKKSFKVSFNTYVPGRKYYGLEKLNLNGEHNDPSVARAKICWDLASRLGIPGSRANHVQLYINGTYFGVYLNVEHIDEEFVQKRFGDVLGNLYKCLWPADLTFISNNPSDYKFESGGRRTYDLKTNTTQDNYADLAELINVLNNTPINQLECELDQVFNVNSYLKAAAFDIMVANWDGPIFNKNNFYLYHDPVSDLFEYIPYDLDNTLGIDWFGEDWALRNIYSWSTDWEERPLYQKLMQVPVYRARFTYFVQQIANQQLLPSVLFSHIDNIKDLLQPSIATDPLYPASYGFNTDDFNNSFTGTLNYNHTPYGIIPYLSTRRSSALSQWETTNSSPIIERLRNNFPDLEEAIIIKAELEDESMIEATLYFSTDGVSFQSVPFLDNGLQGDDVSGDGTFGAVLPGVNTPSQVRYYLEAIDADGQSSRAPACGEKTIAIAVETVQLVINEFMASNTNTHADEWGEFDDWIEISNVDNQSIFLGNLFLSDDPDDRAKWQMPAKVISPGQHMIFWADDSPSQGEHHCNFKLKASGEHIGIYSSLATGLSVIDTLSYGEQVADLSQGRLPNGSGPIQDLAIASPGQNNELATALHTTNGVLKHQISPNPFQETVVFEFETNKSATVCFKIRQVTGQLVYRECLPNPTDQIRLEWNGQNQAGHLLPHGLYWVVLELDGHIVFNKSLVFAP